MRSAPAAIIARVSASVRIPPDALTPNAGPTASRSNRTSASVAPPAGWNPVDVFTKSAPAAFDSVRAIAALVGKLRGATATA